MGALMTNENDRKLLELAALAAGYDAMEGYGIMGPPFLAVDGKHWDPLVDDGDALRLAVELGLKFETRKDAVGVFVWLLDGDVDVREWGHVREAGSYAAAARLAITRAAAEIGKQLKEKNHA